MSIKFWSGTKNLDQIKIVCPVEGRGICDFKIFKSLERVFFLTEGQNNFGNENTISLDALDVHVISNVLDLRCTLQSYLFQKSFWPFSAWINCSSAFIFFFCLQPWIPKVFFLNHNYTEQFFFLTEGQDNFGNKIPYVSLAAEKGLRQSVLELTKPGTIW